VTAFSTSTAKEEEARSLGAHFFVNSRDVAAIKKLAGSFDLILSTINQDMDWPDVISTLRPHGTLCMLGIPPSPVSAPVFPLVVGQRSITGSPTGSPSMLQEMLKVAARHGVKAMTERFPMSQVNEAIAKLKKNQVRYRAVLVN
jgi:uncharacterized zinc-type alcohol dehydrogenase-like protein